MYVATLSNALQKHVIRATPIRQRRPPPPLTFSPFYPPSADSRSKVSQPQVRIIICMSEVWTNRHPTSSKDTSRQCETLEHYPILPHSTFCCIHCRCRWPRRLPPAPQTSICRAALPSRRRMWPTSHSAALARRLQQHCNSAPTHSTLAVGRRRSRWRRADVIRCVCHLAPRVELDDTSSKIANDSMWCRNCRRGSAPAYYLWHSLQRLH